MQNKTSFYLVLITEILAIVLAVFGMLPREIVLVATGILAFYFIFSKIEDGLILFIFSIHHPISEILKQIEINGRQAFLLTPYFHNKKYSWNMLTGVDLISYGRPFKNIMNSRVNKGLKGMQMISYHHTFENIIGCLNGAGFVIERLLEPKPPKRAEKYNKKRHERTSKFPSFCIIKARKA